MRHLQECLDKDLEPSPGVVDGAKSVAAGVAAWESIKTGEVVKAFNEFGEAEHYGPRKRRSDVWADNLKSSSRKAT
jgi:hypothetical protein